MKSHREKIIEADARACQWLAKANALIESGKQETKAHKDAERKAQHWLDRLNKLEGWQT
jgi:hypothetical protein